MTLLLIFVTCALLVIALTMLMNVFVFPRLRASDTPATTPLVSVLIPARNEAAIIAQTVRKWQQQTYANYEVIVLDDNSDDDTATLARTAGATVITGKPLPAGWSGKSWACHTLSQAANGEILLFTDADVQWQPQALSGVIAQMQRTDVDLFTVWPTQQTETLPERLTVPLMALVILGYLPIVMTHYTPFSMFAAANGQCMAWRRNAYESIGGHQIVANNVLDDVTMARAAKAAGFSLRMADGNRLVQTRMYHDWQSVRDGFAKNILAGYGNSVFALLAATIFHWLLFIVPWLLLCVPDYRGWASLLIMLGISVRALSAAYTHQRVQDALLMPISALLMTVIAAQSIYWHYTGGPRWKGRTLSSDAETDHATAQPTKKDTSSWNPPSSSAQASAD